MKDSPIKISDMARPKPPMSNTGYLDALNAPQREAVEALDGPLLILAGAGTGKTRVLTTRFAHLLAMGKARPWEILCVTFTNKAAREMRQRVAKLIGDEVEGIPWLGTFHSISAKILRKHAELVGLKSAFTILDTDDQLRLLKQIIISLEIDVKRWTPRHIASLIDGWKNRGLGADKISQSDGWGFADGKGAQVYQLYQQRLQALNAVDFGDLLLHTLQIFIKYPDVLAEYHRKFRYLLVDEYQDTNVCQYLWLRLLARGSNNLCVVGDDDQSIYGWRGAEVDNILRFESDFPGAKVVKLEQNYRSTAHILATAAKLITANQDRLGKTLWTDEDGGEKVKVFGVWDGEAEAIAAVEEIENWYSKSNSYEDCAVLVRASRQMRAFEERFISLGLPYRVVGGPRFFERLEIRDAHAYMRCVMSDADDLAFERIINTPKRGIGAASVQKLQTLARTMEMSLMSAARRIIETDEIGGKARNGIRTLLKDFEHWRQMATMTDHDRLAELVLDESGYTAMWQNDKSPQAEGRLENLKELVQAMGEFDTLPEYLEHVALVSERDTGNEDDQISLMTLHAAKGLEFPLVILPGWEENTFPSQRSLDETGNKALEEERRLAYVGLTRAKQQAIIYFAANRQIYGSWQAVLPSRFVDELPPEHVEARAETGYYGHQARTNTDSDSGANYDTPGWRRFQALKSSAKPYIEGTARAKPKSADGKFALNQRVFHDKFGYGRINSIDGDKAEVSFDKAGTKKLMISFLKNPDDL
ncbi:MAG: UvrD-helicase domain-containing protein [Robiginitomaculum sp.]|nr:UvrD-helicase domain-containing protein [Robiginitomaculum sp.]